MKRYEKKQSDDDDTTTGETDTPQTSEGGGAEDEVSTSDEDFEREGEGERGRKMSRLQVPCDGVTDPQGGVADQSLWLSLERDYAYHIDDDADW